MWLPNRTSPGLPQKWDRVHSRRGVSIPTGLCSHICSHSPWLSREKRSDRNKPGQKNQGSVWDIIKYRGGRGGRRRGVSREKRNMNLEWEKPSRSPFDSFKEEKITRQGLSP